QDGPLHRPAPGVRARSPQQEEQDDEREPAHGGASSVVSGENGERVKLAAAPDVVKTDYREPRYRRLREIPLTRDTSSAARRRGTPASTRSATAARATSSPTVRGSRGGPMTIAISPFGGSAKRAASSSAVPRATSSNFFVNSRHTATSRAGSCSASERNVAGRRCADSNATDGHAAPASSSQSFFPRGKNPRNW